MPPGTPAAAPPPGGSSRADAVADAALRLLAERGMRGLTHRAVDEAAGLPQGSTSNHARTRLALLETAVRRLAEREARVLTPSELPVPAPAPGTGPRPASGPGSGPAFATGEATGTVPVSAAGDAAAPSAGEATGPGTGTGTGTGPAPAARDAAGPAAVQAIADALALALHRYLTGHRELLLARYELALEATRRPELRTVFDAAGRRFRDPLTAMMTAAGSTDPARQVLSLVAWCDGLMFSCVAGSYHDSTPSAAALRADAREILTGLLGPR